MNEAQKHKKSEDPRGTRKPRGLGGVILIMALLTALFVVVSKTASEQPSSAYDFWARLFNGQIRSTEWTDGTVVARYWKERENGPQGVMEVVLRDLSNHDRDLIRELLPRTLDTQQYGTGTDACASSWPTCATKRWA